MSNITDAYDSVSVHEVERILELMKQSWLHGFPVVKKEDGRTENELVLQASLFLLVATGCITRDQEADASIIVHVRKCIEQGGRLALDAMDFLEQVRSPDRYTRKSVLRRKQKKAKA